VAVVKKNPPVTDLVEAIVEHAKRTAPPDEYGVHFIDHDDKLVGWARVEHCGSFEEAPGRAVTEIARIDPQYVGQHDKTVQAYKVTHHASGEEKIIFRVTA
jgi:hypothetical protein